jgi:hypothetical protein
MVFTVVNYLPLLEEEVAHTKKAMSKKGESSESGSGEPDDETETETENVSVISHLYNWKHREHSLTVFENAFHHYDYLSDGICSPPPEK